MTKETSHTEPTGFSTMTSSIEFADNYNSWILKKFTPYFGEHLVEVGTGQGNFRKYLEGKVKTYTSIDIDEDVIRRAKERDPKGNYIVADAAGDSFIEQLKGVACDTVICINVLEHIKDHQKAIDNMLSVVQPGGHLLLFVPAFQSLYSTMDSMVGHHRRYRKKDLSPIVNPAKGRVVANEYFNAIGGVGWWVNKFMKHNNIDNKALNTQVLFFDKYIVPVSKLINPVSKHIFGQSLIAVIQRV